VKPEEYIIAYEAALASQDWKMVDPLISDDAYVIFSNGAVHHGKKKIEMAFTKNFELIKSEKYTIENVKWLKREDNYAVYFFEYHWTGIINEKSVSGSGIGTTIIINENDNWQLLSEHLAKSA